MLEQGLIKWQQLLNHAWQVQSDLAGGQLSQNEFDYLACIYEAEKIEPEHPPQEHDDSSHLSAIALQMKVRKSSASLMVNKLQKRGFLARVTCRYDARAQHILLTDSGREVFLATTELVYGQLAKQIKGKLGDEQVEQLLLMIDTLV